jgi:hypothetical protein
LEAATSAETIAAKEKSVKDRDTEIDGLRVLRDKLEDTIAA